MNKYEDSFRRGSREANWTFWRVLPLIILTVVVFGGISFALNSLGVWGHTVVERKVFEQSYQRSESIRAQIATDEAALAEIEHNLANPGLDENTRYALKAQAAAARMRIAAAKGKR
jgi:hypothetical protein